jgi:putative drug exporter of the RND superfamily
MVLRAVTTTAPGDPATSRTLERVRDLVPANVSVSGLTAMTDDLSRHLARMLPVFVAAILAASFLLLMLVFRSILVPLKAVPMNLLSIGGAYGVIVAVFQWGWLNVDSVARGIAATGRVITSGALIMAAVFLAFVANPSPFARMLGLGLATAVLLDATVVRLILVPAVMTLLGPANWWLPGWLHRRLPRLSHASPAPKPSAATPSGTRVQRRQRPSLSRSGSGRSSTTLPAAS